MQPLDDYSSLMPYISRWEAGQARFVGDLLYERLLPHSVIDIGCGPGNYLVPFREHGCEVLGIDGDEHAGSDLSSDEFKRIDLRVGPLGLMRNYDLVLCIEVAEHLQPQYAETLVAHCVYATVDGYIFWSAARPGQGGLFHHNEQPRDYWLNLFSKYGYGVSSLSESIQGAISSSEECKRVGWLLNNAILLSRVGK